MLEINSSGPALIILVVNCVFFTIIHRCDKISKIIKMVYGSQIVCDVRSGSSLSVYIIAFNAKQMCKFVNI